MAGFKKGSIDFKKRSDLTGSDVYPDHVNLYSNGDRLKYIDEAGVIRTLGISGEVGGGTVDLTDYSTTSEIAGLTGSLQGQISTNDIDINEIRTDVDTISGNLGNYATLPLVVSISGDLQTQIDNISAGASAVEDLTTTETDTDLVLKPDGIGGTTWGIDKTSSGGDFSDYTTTSELVGLTGNLQDQITSNDGDIVVLKTDTDTISGNLDTHTSDLTIHYSQASISITENQISDLGDYATVSLVASISGDLQTQMDNISGGTTDLSNYSTTSEIVGLTGSLQGQISTNDVDITGIRTDTDTISGNLETHEADLTVHYTSESINISASQIIDLPVTSTIENIATTENNTGLVLKPDGTGGVLWTTDLSGSGGTTDLSNYSTTSEIAGLTGNLQTQITSNDGEITNLTTGVDAISGDLVSHTNNASVHYTQGSISIVESQISDLGDYSSTSLVTSISGDLQGQITSNDGDITGLRTDTDTISGNLDGHANFSSVHYTQGSISITENQVSDLGDYATNTKVDTISGDLVSHEADLAIHYTTESINISASQIIDLPVPVITTVENIATTENNVAFVLKPDGTGGVEWGIDVTSSGAGGSAVEDLSTTETNGLLVLKPDGVGGVTWTTDISGSGGTDLSNYSTTSEILAFGDTLLVRITSNDMDIIDLRTDTDTISGNLETHEADLTIHYTTESINISASQIIDLPVTTTVENIATTENNTGLFLKPDGTGGVLWTTDLSGSGGTDLSNYSTTSEIAGLTGNLQGQITSNDGDITGLRTDVDVISGNLDGHVNDASKHFTVASINITESQVSDLGDYATNTQLASISGDLQDQLTSNDSNISSLTTGVDTISGNLVSHEADLTIHYTTESINISASQIIDLPVPVTTTVENIATTETNGDLVLKPDGVGGVLWTTDLSGSGGTDLSGYSTTSEITGLTGNLQDQITSNDGDITGLRTDTDTISGNLVSHEADLTIHYTTESINISASQIIDLPATTTVENISTTENNVAFVLKPDGTGGVEWGIDVTASGSGGSAVEDLTTTETNGLLVLKPDGIGGVLWTTDLSGSGGTDLSNYSTTSEIAGLTGNLQGQITSNDDDITGIRTDVGVISGNLVSHDADLTIHYTTESINISASQIIDLPTTNVENIATTETDGLLVLKPDGVGGVTWATDLSGSGGTDLSSYSTTSEIAGLTGDLQDQISSNDDDITGIRTDTDTISGNLVVHTSDASIHFTEASISITESQVSDLGDYATNTKVDTISGNLVSHETDLTIHYTTESINISASQIIDLPVPVTTTVENITTTETNGDLVLKPDGVGGVLWTTDLSGSGGTTDLSSYSTTSEIAGLTGNLQDQITSNNGDITGLRADTDTISGNLDSHTNDASIHFTEGSISITESQVSDLGDYATNTKVDTISGNLVSHEADLTIHYTTESINISASQIIDLPTTNVENITTTETNGLLVLKPDGVGGVLWTTDLSGSGGATDLSSYSTTSEIAGLTGNLQDQITSNDGDIVGLRTDTDTISGNLVSHEADLTIHYTSESINISASQIIDLPVTTTTTIENITTTETTDTTLVLKPDGVGGVQWDTDMTSSGGGSVVDADLVHNFGTESISGNKTFEDAIIHNGNLIPGVETITAVGATFPVDAELSRVFELTLTQNATLSNPTNPSNGMKIEVAIIQNGTGNWVLSLDTKFVEGDLAFTITATANSTTYAGFQYHLASDEWRLLALQGGF